MLAKKAVELPEPVLVSDNVVGIGQISSWDFVGRSVYFFYADSPRSKLITIEMPPAITVRMP